MAETTDKLNGYRPVIGMEIHVQLKTKTKMFSPVANNPDEMTPNTNIDEISTGQPGILPTINEEAVRLGLMMGMALNCEIPEFSKFDRKHYFYPDLPKAYQISQYDKPIAQKGYVDITVDGVTKRIGITRAHLEEDAGKNMHPEGLPYSLVDYNRAGAPLLEIVTEPDIESAAEAKAFLQELRNIVRYIGAGSADMEKGTMRLEPNISVRKPGETTLPKYKVEVKNINSFKFAEQAIEYEIARHIEQLESGVMPKQVTMGWNEKENRTVEQRSKEEANDYRYFPEPDLPVMRFSQSFLDGIRATIPELPAAKRKRFVEEYNLPLADIAALMDWKELNGFFEDVVSELQEWYTNDIPGPKKDIGVLAKAAANWCIQDFSALLNAAHQNPEDSNISASHLAQLIRLVIDGTISSSAAKQVLVRMQETGAEPTEIVNDLGLAQVSDAGAIEAALKIVLEANPKAVADYKAGQEKSFGFLVGMAMKELRGKGNPQVVNELLKDLLAKM
jgi:aspartyl-tRNA(Asn)/glutamyl-tRNA(Gln) amidotransferase subunit B